MRITRPPNHSCREKSLPQEDSTVVVVVVVAVTAVGLALPSQGQTTLSAQRRASASPPLLSSLTVLLSFQSHSHSRHHSNATIRDYLRARHVGIVFRHHECHDLGHLDRLPQTTHAGTLSKILRILCFLNPGKQYDLFHHHLRVHVIPKKLILIEDDYFS